jgi:hypothetical protein
MTESELKTFNNRRMAFLRTLVHEAESAGRACDRWLASGHIADYRTWQWRAKQLEEADVQYADFRSSAH